MEHVYSKEWGWGSIDIALGAPIGLWKPLWRDDPGSLLGSIRDMGEGKYI